MDFEDAEVYLGVVVPNYTTKKSLSLTSMIRSCEFYRTKSFLPHARKITATSTTQATLTILKSLI
ncbi:hypothetical protein KVL05_06240 [Helicobacter pylori]|nr:hypothetical protein KVL05_06240 [Helicobacter pylori]